MNSKDAYIKQLENTINDLQNQVNNLTEIVLLLRKEKFGSKSEYSGAENQGVRNLSLIDSGYRVQCFQYDVPISFLHIIVEP